MTHSCNRSNANQPSGTHRVGYVSDLRERSAFMKSVTLARESYENRRRKFPALLAEDHTTIAAAVLKQSFWPFREYPLCSIVTRPGRYPCNLSFPNRYTIEVPRYAGSHWDFLHQLAHWCLPLEGHNENFCSFYAVLVDAAFGADGRRRLVRAYDECGVAYNPDWLKPVAARPEGMVQTDPQFLARPGSGHESLQAPSDQCRRYGT